MKTNLENCIKLTFGSEGGYVNHPRDPGGPTKYGITQSTLANYRKTHVTAEDVKALGLSEAAAILDMQYWRKVWGDNLPKGIDYVLFDFAVNSGPAQAVKKAQELLNMDRDGIMGAFTFNALSATDPEIFIRDYQSARLKYLKGLKIWSTFGNGWSTRVEHVLRASLAMLEKPVRLVAEKAAPKEEPTAAIDGNAGAPPRETRVVSTPEGQTSITTIVGSIITSLGTAGAMLTPYQDISYVKTILVGFAIIGAAVTLIGGIAAFAIQRKHIDHGNPL